MRESYILFSSPFDRLFLGSDLLQELDRLRALAAQYNINVVDPDAADDDSNGSGQVSDSDVTPSLSGASTPPFGSMMNGNGDVQAGGMVHSWSVSNPPQLSLTPQAIAQRKYRAKLKVCTMHIYGRGKYFNTNVMQCEYILKIKLDEAKPIATSGGLVFACLIIARRTGPYAISALVESRASQNGLWSFELILLMF